MVSPERNVELDDLFWRETSEEWTQAWRGNLTAEEAALIDQWDNQFDHGVSKLVKSILGVTQP